jgi:transposase
MYGLWAGTRLHEAGIPSNRVSPRHGETKSYGDTNRSSREERFTIMKLLQVSTYKGYQALHPYRVIKLADSYE